MLGKLFLVKISKFVVLVILFKIVKCNCKINCVFKRCICRKSGLGCFVSCGECCGICFNFFEFGLLDILDDVNENY